MDEKLDSVLSGISMVSERAFFAIESAAVAFEELALERGRPFHMMKPSIQPNGNQWCVLYGKDIQSGICGFGDTPELAAKDFDKEWNSAVRVKVKK